MSRLSHLDKSGRARMVDVSAKAQSEREAVAEGLVRMSPKTRELALSGAGKKGEVVAVAELAGVMAAKRTAEIIPLCHSLPLGHVEVRIEPAPAGLAVTARARTVGRTGVEMEALTAVSIACLTLYDMLKAAERGMVIEAVRLVEKRGGASGEWQAPKRRS
ncbi:MAG TPA: cyclic pyranopterin monophosphate synthase MoaC [Caulobacteraceae bacterium]|nr:cyclic pyranopterin monophosphate synthase MoaC [Caulobacteraceae bacterium]